MAACWPTSPSPAWADEHYRVVTGAGSLAGDLGWLRASVLADDPPATIDDTSERWACFGLWGPAARDVLAAVTDDDVSDSGPADAPGDAAIAHRPGARSWPARLSYVGELGWELDRRRRSGRRQVWDRLVAAGRARRSEIGRLSGPGCPADGEGLPILRHRPDDVETPDEAGLGAFVRPAKGHFIGRRRGHPAARGRSRRSRSSPTDGGHRRRYDVPARLRRRGGPPRGRGGRAAAQRDVRLRGVPDRRLRLPPARRAGGRGGQRRCPRGARAGGRRGGRAARPDRRPDARIAGLP